MQGRCRPNSCKTRFLEECPSNETIDKLAYDTEHHPSEIIKVHCQNKNPSKDLNYRRDTNCPCLQLNIVKPKFKHQQKPEGFCSFKGQRGIKENNCKRRKFTDSKYECSSYHSKPWHIDVATGRSVSPGDDLVSSPVAEDKMMNNDYGEKENKTFGRFVERGEEEARYAKFVYDITQEIVRNGFYTDRELKEVFEKHLERCSGYLNKRKMLYEIFQLKISLNIMDDSEDEDETEADFIFAEKFSNLRVPKPPTPPKILNENKIFEKLQSFNQQQEVEHNVTSSQDKKNVVLIDANQEFLVTERDILSILMDNHVNPEKIQRIYKHLVQRSKDMSLCEAVQVGKEIAYTHRLKHIDKGISTISLNLNEKGHGILRKESTKEYDNKTLSSQTSYHRDDYINNKRDQILDKHEKQKLEYNYKTQKNTDSVEKKNEMQQSLTKISDQKINYISDTNLNDEENLESKAEKLPMNKPDKIENLKTLASSEMKQNHTGKERDFTSNTESSDAHKMTLNEENEEIEEDIESEIEDLSDKSRKSSNIEKENVQIVNEINEDDEYKDDDGTSITSINSHESFKYSDDFSNGSESSSKSSASHFQSDEEVMSTVPTNKVKNLYSSIKDYVKQLSIPDNNTTWKIESSSESSSTSNFSGTKNKARTNYAERNLSNASGSNRVIKKRTSCGINGLKTVNTWNERVSKLSGDFYVKLSNNYCSTNCRESVTDKNCSNICKFVKTNCKYLSGSKNCLNNVENSESSDSSNS